MVFDCLNKQVDVARILSLYDSVGKGAAVVDRVELAFEVLFEQICVVDALNSATKDYRLLLCEVDELRNLLKVWRLLVQSDAVATLLDYKAGIAEGVDISVDCTT